MHRALPHLGAWRVWLARARVAAATTARALADRAAGLAYRPAEVGVLALLASSLVGGLAIDRWRMRQPLLLEWLEAEPPRLGARTPAREWGSGQVAAVERPAGPRAAPVLDLNRATAGDLARLPGIGPRLAARIVEARAARGGRFESSADLVAIPGLGRRRAAAMAALVTTDGLRPPHSPPAESPEKP
jgi:competence protein ComEA